MSSTAITVRGLSKRYRLGASTAGYRTIRESINATLARLTGRGVDRGPTDENEVWALKDVTFSVPSGQVVGIIGRNGAGKSTLLKALSRITAPTEGSIEIDGRVGSLLEVGTGFHPELSGRENIFLNGAILGMSRSEIGRRFDEIVSFSEIERFLDTPVKRYSSGMYMRLAFAVAAHLDPEVLIIDEVLAVGDAAFQQKCIGRMGDVARQGRTVLFVSHNLTAVARLCTSGIMLSGGRLVAQGPVDDVLTKYASLTSLQHQEAKRSGAAIIRETRMAAQRESDADQGLYLDMEFDVDAKDPNIGIDIMIRCGEVGVCFCSSAYYSDLKLQTGFQTLKCTIGPVRLATGQYQIDLKVCKPMVVWLEDHDNVITFTVERDIGGMASSFSLDARRNLGYVIPRQSWTIGS